MNEHTIRADAKATLARLKEKHPELKKPLEDSYGYAIFPSVGRASILLGLAYGQGEVFRQGKPIGFATLSQVTLGVQVGGQTFSEVLLFHQKESLEEFLQGKVAFTSNASATIFKAAASGTSNFDGVTAHAYSRGGMLLEASLGGQKFSFIPPRRPEVELGEEGADEEESRRLEAAAEAVEDQETMTPTRV